MIKKQILLYASGVLLCFIMLSTQTLVVTSNLKPANALISIQSQTESRTLQASGMEFPAIVSTTLESFANGTQEATIAVNMTLEDGGDVCVTMSTTLPPAGMQVQSSTNTPSLQYSTQDDAGLYQFTTVVDSLNFLLPGKNDSDTVTYLHDNNYDGRGYYPGKIYKSFTLPDDNYPAPNATKHHIHIPTDVLKAWIDGNVSTENIVTYAFGIGGGVLTALGGLLAIYHMPWAGWAAIVAGISAIFQGVIRMMGFGKMSDYLQSRVKEQDIKYQDGWEWQWGWRTVSSFGWITSPPIGCPQFFTPEDLYQISQYHIVEGWVYNKVEFQQSMGADIDYPERYTIEAYDYVQFPSGVLGFG